MEERNFKSEEIKMEERKIEVITNSDNLPIYVNNHINAEVIYYQYDGHKLVCKTSIRNPLPMVVDLERYEVDEYSGEVTHYCTTNGSATKETIYDAPLSSCSYPNKIYKEYYDYDELTIFYDACNQHQAMNLRKYKDEDTIDISVNFTTFIDNKKITAYYILPLSEDTDTMPGIEEIDTSKAFLRVVLVKERNESGDYIESEYFSNTNYINLINLESKSNKKYLSEHLTSIKDIIDSSELELVDDSSLTEGLTLLSTKVIPEHEEIDSEYHEYQQIIYYTNGRIAKLTDCKKIKEYKYENSTESEIYVKSTYIKTVTQYDMNGNIVEETEEEE